MDSWVGKIPRRREWLPTPVFWPGEFHGQRSLAGPWGCKESDTNEQLTHFSVFIPLTLLTCMPKALSSGLSSFGSVTKYSSKSGSQACNAH